MQPKCRVLKPGHKGKGGGDDVCQDGPHSCMASSKCGENGERKRNTFETEKCAQIDLGSRGRTCPLQGRCFPLETLHKCRTASLIWHYEVSRSIWEDINLAPFAHLSSSSFQGLFAYLYLYKPLSAFTFHKWPFALTHVLISFELKMILR